MMRKTRVALAMTAVAALAMTTTGVAGAGGGSEKGKRTVIVFNGEGNNLNAYEAKPPFEKQTVITNHNDDAETGLDINAQICFFPKGVPGPGKGETWFIAGEDTGQPDPPPGWGIFQLEGKEIGKFEAEQVGKLTPTYQPTGDNPENYGCGFLSDGRVVTTDIGNQAGGERNGQLIVWFPPYDSRDVKYCKIDVAIGTAGQIHVDGDDNVYVTSALDDPAGIRRYTGPFPTSDDAEGGCGQTDTTGAPLADSAEYEIFITTDNNLATPFGVVPKPGGGFYASSVFTGTINEYDESGAFVRNVLSPAPGEVIGEQTFTTGTPLGLGIDSKGNLYYADIAITFPPGGVPGPGPGGKVRRIRFEDGEPLPPEIMGDDLAFPDGIGVLEVKKKG